MSSARSSRSSNRKKTLAPEKFNISHPEISEQVEHAFTVGKTKYYRFKDEFRMPAGRYKYIYAYLREVDLRMSLETLKYYVQELKKCLNGEKKSVDLENAWKIIFSLETRTNLAFEPEGVKRLASVTYFDATEDLSTFDHKYGEAKIKSWTRSGTLDFFLTRPISELLGVTGISVTSLQEYLTTSEAILTELALGLPPQLRGSS